MTSILRGGRPRANIEIKRRGVRPAPREPKPAPRIIVPTIAWPAAETPGLASTAPPGWTWGRLVSRRYAERGRYLIRDSDDATVIATPQADVTTPPSVAYLNEIAGGT